MRRSLAVKPHPHPCTRWPVKPLYWMYSHAPTLPWPQLVSLLTRDRPLPKVPTVPNTAKPRFPLEDHVALPSLKTECGEGDGLAACPTLGLLVTSFQGGNSLSVWGLPGGACGGGGVPGGAGPGVSAA